MRAGSIADVDNHGWRRAKLLTGGQVEAADVFMETVTQLPAL